MRGSTRRERPADDKATPSASPVPASPPARRVKTPSWFDLRLIAGVVLVLGSVLVGARVVAAADKSSNVWGLTTNLSAGVVLKASDLRQVQVRLYDNGASYVSTTTSPVGRTLSRNVGAGELLPASALATGSDYATVSLAVPAARVPATLRRGEQVNIYAKPEDAGATTEVARGVTVLEVSGRSTGALSVGSASLQVLISVPECHVAEVIDATEGQTVSLAVLPTGSVTTSFSPCGVIDPPPASASPSAPSSTPAAPTS